MIEFHVRRCLMKKKSRIQVVDHLNAMIGETAIFNILFLSIVVTNRALCCFRCQTFIGTSRIRLNIFYGNLCAPFNFQVSGTL